MDAPLVADLEADNLASLRLHRFLPLLMSIAGWIAGAVLRVVRGLIDCCAFYWSFRRELWWQLRRRIPFAASPTPSAYEVRLSAMADEGFAWDGVAWVLSLPDCCVVCGEQTDREWSTETRTVDNFTRPFWSPLVGLAGGVVSWLCLPAIPGFGAMCLFGALAGTAVGYFARRQVRVELHLRRCDKHVGNTELPSLRAFSDQLVVGFGKGSVRQEFASQRGDYRSLKGGNRERAAPSAADEMAVGALEAVVDDGPIPVVDSDKPGATGHASDHDQGGFDLLDDPAGMNRAIQQEPNDGARRESSNSLEADRPQERP